MGVLLLVRHGQGSMGTSDYDQLSELGHVQARLTGARLARADLAIGQVWSGALARQRETADVLLAELGRPPTDLHTDPRLDEYDPQDILAPAAPASAPAAPANAPAAPANAPAAPANAPAAGAQDPFAAATTPQSRRALQVTLDQALTRWIQGGAGYPETHGAFTARVNAAVTDLAALSGTTLAVTSAGVIAVACARLAGLPADRWPALARVAVNASITKLITGSTGTHLLTFNDHAHLEGDRSLITYR